MSVKIHFLDVGAGDCTIIDFPNRTSGDERYTSRIMMIDINSCPDSGYTDVIKYFKGKFSKRSLFRFVCTHPHKDHITGLNELFDESGMLSFKDTGLIYVFRFI
jgi:competence protein ComEC